MPIEGWQDLRTLQSDQNVPAMLLPGTAWQVQIAGLESLSTVGSGSWCTVRVRALISGEPSGRTQTAQ